MVEMAAATAIFLIAPALLLSLMLGLPWWAQSAGIVVGAIVLAKLTRWLVTDSLAASASSFLSGTKATVDFDYIDAKGEFTHCIVDVSRVTHHHFEGYCLTEGRYRKFTLARVSGDIRGIQNGKLRPVKAWAGEMCHEPPSGIIGGI